MAEKPKAKYASSRQIDRQDRIVKCAKKLIEKKGVQGLTMRALAQESGVAYKTLYNIYGDKEILIVEVLKEFFTVLEGELNKFENLEDPLKKMQFIVKQACNEDLLAPEYTRALMMMYFNVDKRTKVHDELRRLTSDPFLGVLKAMQKNSQIPGWVSTQHTADDIADRMAAAVGLWLRNEIAADNLYTYMWHSVLTVVASIASESLFPAVRKKLRDSTREIEAIG